MIDSKKIPMKLWDEAANRACYIINTVSVYTSTEKTCFELWKGYKSFIKYSYIFGSICYILNDMEYMKKLDLKSDE